MTKGKAKKAKNRKLDLTRLNKQLIREVEIRGEKVAIYSVNGTYIRDNFYQDFTQGGHKWVSENYHFIPDKEIFIDEVLNEKDREATIIHEVKEYEEMKFKGIDYDTAHEKANDVEKEFRENKPEPDNSEIKELYNKKTIPSNRDNIIHTFTKINLTEKDKELLYNWEGEGSVKGGDSKTGILHEFFTPYWLCKALADIVKDLGIKTDKVLDPAIGTGRLIRYLNAKKVIGFEVNNFNFRITHSLYSKATIYNQAFETAFLNYPRFNSLAKKSWIGNDFDLVISNPPYGEYAGEYKSYMPKIFTRFECLFVAMSMKLVKSGGYGIFILPQSFMNNGNMYNRQKEEIMKECKFVDAVRLPNAIFASTDIGVDVLILQKL